MKVIVTGATSAIGRCLLPRLKSAGHEVIAISRHHVEDDDMKWLEADLIRGEWPDHAKGAVLIHLAPLWLLPDFLEHALATGLGRIIAIGSTSIFTKTDSVTAEEREITRLLAQGEASLQKLCEQSGAPWVLFRPTLIYGLGLDKNVSAIARMIEKWGVFVIPGHGKGLRQPVHADDIAAACESALDGRGDNQAFNLSGGSTITYTVMVKQIFNAVGKKQRIFHLPAGLIRSLVPLARRLPRFRHLTSGMVERIDADLCFDHSAAASALGYSPRPFLQHGRDDLGIQKTAR